MNKQELIKELEKRKTKGSHIGEVGVNSGLNTAIDLAKQLDEPKKVVVPQIVADWIKYAKQQGYGFMQSYDPRYTSYPINNNLDKWIDDNEETFAHAWVVGCEVEKEQLYKVVIDNKYLVQIFSGRTDARLVEYEELTNWHDSAYKLTESVIKSIDERYWPFAVKVDGE
ncbi:DUF1642 domain-containing protein [Enterococcus faecalis]|nr:DUF1642 domain-containing protein [Enterococcus faecalis]